jgi:8-hydroxy-5-deazaflavin:NADPH oxidoreductase
MKITILGTGSVGQTFATKLIELGHHVMMGTRSPEETLQREKFAEWHQANTAAQLVAFSEGMMHADIILNALKGEATLEVFKQINAEAIAGKIIMDVSNPLDSSKGFPPPLIPELVNTNSLAEEIQQLLPHAKVVKTLSTMWCGLMVNPMMIGNGDHNAFIAGNDADAKTAVITLMESFGWIPANIIDLGAITKARGVEMYLPLWLSIFGATNNGAFNIKIVS